MNNRKFRLIWRKRLTVCGKVLQKKWKVRTRHRVHRAGGGTSTKEAVNFLMHIFNDSTSDLASILCAQADNDTETIKNYLITIHDYVTGLIERVNNE